MLESLQFHLWRFALHTGVQRCNTNALQHWSGQRSFPTVQCCSVILVDSMLVSLQIYLWGGLLLTQVGSDATNMLCSTGQGKVASPLFTAALQNRLTAGSVSLQLHLWRFALHTGVQ